MTDLENMSQDELKALKKKVAKAIKDYDKRQRQKAVIEANAVARQYGFSLNDLTSAKPGTTKNPPKYANPDDPSETWTGRGRKPNWVNDVLISGRSLEDFLISK